MYKLRITSQPKRRHVKWATIDSIVFADKSMKLKEIYNHYHKINDVIKDIKRLVITLQEEPGKKPRPYPNFLQIDFTYKGIDTLVEELLLQLNIPFETKPIEVTNSTEIKYKLVHFPELPLLDLEKSNAVIGNRGTAVTKGQTNFNPLLSPVFLNENIKNVKGIVCIKELPSYLVCSDDVKELFDKHKLVGVEFTEIEGMQQLKDYYWNAACAYEGAIKEGNYEQAGYQFNNLINLYNKFMNIEKGQTALKELMDHWREPVQLAAATQLLPTFNDEALKVLEKLSTREDLTGVTAKTTLKEWHQGTLKSGWLHGILKMFPSQFRFKKITDKNFGSKN